MNHLWDNKCSTKRKKVPAKQRFLDTIKILGLRPTKKFILKNLKGSSTDTKRKVLRPIWEPPADPFSVQVYNIKHKKALHKKFLSQQKFFPNQKTQYWIRPPGVNCTIINSFVKRYFSFFNGNHIFTATNKLNPKLNFFNLSNIDNGLFLNPPYNQLDLIISKLVDFALTSQKVYPVLLPFWESSKWLQVLRYIGTPILKFKKKMVYIHGPSKKFAKEADFFSIIAFVGAYCNFQEWTIENDILGFPENNSYLKNFSKIIFPLNISSSEQILPQNHLQNVSHMLFSIFENLENFETELPEADITEKFNFDIILKYNFLLQEVNDDIDALDSHSWNYFLNPYLKKHVSWSNIKNKDRVLLNYKEGEKFLSDFEVEPRQKTLHDLCFICKNKGHLSGRCPFRKMTINELGLCAPIEKAFYNFLESQDFNRLKNQTYDQWNSAQKFHEKAIFWLKEEAAFWKRWETYAQQNNIENHKSFLDSSDFSKGRQSLGFNFAQGGQFSELCLDAFGATLDLVNPPPFCEFVKKHDKQENVEYFEIDPQLLKEDEKEIKRRTMYIIPRKLCKYILPRFVVINSDLTKRSINNCRYLGPATERWGYRLPTTKTLRHFSKNDLILSIDGKSAYRQRKLAWSARNMIAFRTKINKTFCYVAMATPPFGLHNSGFIYQKMLEKKLNRVAGNIFWIEYVDDVAIKISSIKTPSGQTQWKSAAFLWLLTKAGEIINNKFFMYQKLITMLGVKYNLHTDRFIPKLNSFYKLGTLLLEIFHRKKVSLLEIEKIAGQVSWIQQNSNPHLLRPLYKFMGKQKSKIHKAKKHQIKALQHKKIPLNKSFAEAIFNILTSILQSYDLFDQSHHTSQDDTLYIVVDSNPSVAGGYLFYKQTSSNFLEIPEIKQSDAISFPEIPHQYLVQHNYLKFINSYKAETTGLLKYLQKHKNIIHTLAVEAKNIIIFGDNLTVINHLEQRSQKNLFLLNEQQQIFKFLENLDLNYHFKWLRRSKSVIKYADALGRIGFSLKPKTFKLLLKTFTEPIVWPEITRDLFSLPVMWPQHQIKKLKIPGKTPLILIGPEHNIHTLEKLTLLLKHHQIKAIIGTPIFNCNKIKTFLETAPVLKIPYINSEAFIGPNISDKKSTNMPYLFAKNIL